MSVQLSPIQELQEAYDALRAEVEEYKQSFDVRWKADMRAIKRWQEAHPGNDLVWPDHADMVVWLLEQDTALRAEVQKLRAVLELISKGRAFMKPPAALEEKT